MGHRLDPQSRWLSGILEVLESKFVLLFRLLACIREDIETSAKASAAADVLAVHCRAEALLVEEIESYRKAMDGILSDYLSADEELKERIAAVRRSAFEASRILHETMESLEASLSLLAAERNSLQLPHSGVKRLYRNPEPAYIDITT